MKVLLQYCDLTLFGNCVLFSFGSLFCGDPVLLYVDDFLFCGKSALMCCDLVILCGKLLQLCVPTL